MLDRVIGSVTFFDQVDGKAVAVRVVDSFDRIGCGIDSVDRIGSWFFFSGVML